MSRAIYTCDNCGQADDHPKLHYGSETYHHDCLPHRVLEDLSSYSTYERDADGAPLLVAREPIPRSELPRQIGEALAIREVALQGTRGDKLRKLITSGKPLRIAGGASGLDVNRQNALLTQLSGGATDPIVAPLKLLFLSAVRATATGSDTEWATSGGYVAGTGFSGLTFAAPVSGAPSTQASNVTATITNAPAGTWAGNKIVDSSGSPKTTFWGTLTGGNKTINAGDTTTVPSGNLQAALG
jgi:hypothetical protein